ncbi:amidohydrolase family protein [Archaeoglobus profundus]|uniref:Amidohydrolase n=1 Tax=Archaeoglobus profundus (strain DSM 5631 / JCM 9629 / NBRC 100127 / Av18) TaxID=572546 RepID=D2REG5_ARCPA|nr:amidohydrolase [Archaeoglobus profundus]ADB58509.1 amidohydrolase [Archaeoglobus profundus DSM 5631]
MYPVELITPQGEILKGIIHKDGYFEERDVKAEFIATPSFFNAHAHLLDSVAKDIPRIDLVKAVGEFKFKALSSTSDDEIKECVGNSVEVAKKSGTTAILNFTEMGVRGYNIIKDFEVLALTRPSNLEEAEILIEKSFGFGMSSVRDHDYTFLEELREIAKRHGKIFAIHAGEKDDDDVEKALALEPELLVHMNMAGEKNLKRAMDMEIPIVSCIRSNAFFGLLNLKNYKILSEYDLWLLGTDNAMVCSPSMLEEMHFASYLLGKDFEIFRACIRGFEIFGLTPMLVLFNKRNNLYKCKNPLFGIVRRAEAVDVEAVIYGCTF